MQKGYPKKELYVVGLAKGYDEAVEVAASIVDEVYQNTGGFAVRPYLEEKRRRGKRGMTVILFLFKINRHHPACFAGHCTYSACSAFCSYRSGIRSKVLFLKIRRCG